MNFITKSMIITKKNVLHMYQFLHKSLFTLRKDGVKGSGRKKRRSPILELKGRKLSILFF
jgi:hypothetical protein